MKGLLQNLVYESPVIRLSLHCVGQRWRVQNVVLSKLTGWGDVLLMGRCWLGLHLDLKLLVEVCRKRRRQKENMPTSSPYLCPCRDFSSGQIAAWSSLDDFTTVIMNEWGHGWYQRWMWTDIPIHPTHQHVAFRMSHLAVEQKYRQKCSDRLLSANRFNVKTLNHWKCDVWAN